MSSHPLLRLLGGTVELLDPPHEHGLVCPAVALLGGGVGQGLAPLGVGRGVAHHVPAECHVLGVTSLIVPIKVGHVAGSVYCLQTNKNKLINY